MVIECVRETGGNECRELLRKQIDLASGVLSIPETKNGRPHSLPITPLMREILERRCSRLGPDDELFAGVSAEHLYNMAMRGRLAPVHAA